MSLRNTNFENWRLSRIEEEIERLSYSSQDTSADDGSCSPRSAEGTLERRGYLKGMGTPGTGKDDGIYSSTALGMNPQGNNAKEEEKDALRFIKEKYDSLGKVKVKKPIVDPPETTQVSTEGNGQQKPEAEEFPATSNPNAPSLMVENSGVSTPRDCAVVAKVPAIVTAAVAASHVTSDVMVNAAAAGGGVRLSQNAKSSCPSSISEQELTQVEMFYRSHKTNVFVCLCQATLYLSDPIRNSFCPLRPDLHQQDRASPAEALVGWTLVKTGIPVLVLDSGESRRQRRLNLVLAERGTGFGLWRDQIDCLSNYESPSVTFHTMHLSNDHSKLIGLRFDDPSSASDFLQHIRRLTSDADDPLLSLASSGDDRKAKKSKKTDASKSKKGKTPVVTKADISQPCCFTHITKLDQSDGSSLLRGQAPGTEFNARNSPRPGSGSGDRHKVKLKP